jgi:hypothetical protein
VNAHRELSGELYGDSLLRDAVRAHFIALDNLRDELYQAMRAASAQRAIDVMKRIDAELDDTLDRYYKSKQPS